MFCPNPECPDRKETGRAGEYVLGTTVCPVCGEYLVESLPGESENDFRGEGLEKTFEPQPGETLEPVFESSDPTEVPVVRSLLDSEGIRYVTTGEEKFDAFRGGLSPFRFHPAAGVVRFLVAASQAEKARELLSEIEIDD